MKKLYLLLAASTFLMSACGGGGEDRGGSNSVVHTTNSKTAFGIGGTSGILSTTSGAVDVVAQLRSSSLTRDPTQLLADGVELSQLREFDFTRTVYGITSNTYFDSMQKLKTLAGIAISAPFNVEIDLRLNPPVSQVGGGHAGHEYFSVDGRYIDIVSEVANYYAMRDYGRVFASEIQAIDQIVGFHNANVGGESLECCYPFSLLTEDEKDRSDYYFWTLFAVMAYHEFGHYYLYHCLDYLRGPLDFSGLVLYSSVNEDDADFVAGVLLAKAGLDRDFGKLAFDLLSYYILQRQGLLFSINQVFNNPSLQLYQHSVSYSSLSARKQNYLRGYNSY